MTRRNGAALIAIVLIEVVLGTAALSAEPVTAQVSDPATTDPRIYRPPVTAPVTDPFRPPAQPWRAGNRGLEYATRPGTSVRAIGPGVVTFAGPVAGSLYVTVRHPDGLRSSYSYLAVVRAHLGDRVQAGQVVGMAAERLHLGVRRDQVYLDPASLWGRRVQGGRVALIPLGGRMPGPAPGPQQAPQSGNRRPGGSASATPPPGRAVSTLGAELVATSARIAELVT